MLRVLVLLGLNALLHFGYLAGVIETNGAHSDEAVAVDPPHTSLPEHFRFLLFPSAEVEVFDTEKFLPSERVGMLDRAVIADSGEVARGVVGVTDRGFVRLALLRYLPETAVKGEMLVKEWEKTLIGLGIYTRGVWGVTDSSDGVKTVTLQLVDDKHGRSETYTYETDGVKVLRVYPKKNVSWGNHVFFLLSFFFTSGVLVILGFLFGRRTRSRDV